jgi:F-type H+-transporting ATPase subunit delta
LSSQTVARRYALALADVAVDRGEAREIQAEVDYWASMIEATPQLREVFGNPTIPYDQKRKVLEQLISRTHPRDTTADFLRVLLKNQRLSQLGDVTERLAQVLDERAGVVAAHVTTARPVPEELRVALHDSLASSTGQKVRLSFSTDETIIGGLVARIGSTVFDGSVQNHLERLAADLAGK